MDLSKMRRDPELEARGVWRTVPGTEGAERPVRFLIAGSANPAYRAALARLTKDRIAEIREGKVSEDEWQDIQHRAASEALLIGWEGYEEHGENGELAEVPYSSERAYALLSDPGYRGLRDWVFRVAEQAENYRAEALRDASGN